ncbi:MAG: glycosyltransferase [Flavobacteriales bacterium]|nr:glycosyltransferase [Flavobacteriales bacterium]
MDGGTKAMHNLTRGLLTAGHHVRVMCIHTPKHPFPVKDIPEDYARRTQINSVFVDTSLNVVDAFTDLVTSDNYNISRFFSPDMDIELIKLLSADRFDVVLLESLFMTPYIPTIRRYSLAKVILRSHNLEHVIQERIASGEKNILKRPYRRFLARQLKDYEMAVLDRVDGVAAISPADAQKFAEHGKPTPIATIPFGLIPEDYEVSLAKGPVPDFFHLGSMDWLPNEEGIRWLLTSLWPKVVKKHPRAQLHLAGNKMPKDLIRSKIEGATIKGRIKSAEDYMAKHDVMLVPLFSAGGMRVKIIEGMAMGKCVISTPVGAEGIEYTAGKDLLIAKNQTEFLQHMDRILRDPMEAVRIGTKARELVEQRYSDKRIVKDLLTFLRSTLRQ